MICQAEKAEYHNHNSLEGIYQNLADQMRFHLDFTCLKTFCKKLLRLTRGQFSQQKIHLLLKTKCNHQMAIRFQNLLIKQQSLNFKKMRQNVEEGLKIQLRLKTCLTF